MAIQKIVYTNLQQSEKPLPVATPSDLASGRNANHDFAKELCAYYITRLILNMDEKYLLLMD